MKCDCLMRLISPAAVVSKMGVLAEVDHNCNTSLNKVRIMTEVSYKCKIPDYAKDYKNEFLFVRGIDKCFACFLNNINKATSGVFQNHRVDKINKLIGRFEKAKQLNYLNDISDKEIDEIDVNCSILLLERLLDLSDFYVDDEWE